MSRVTLQEGGTPLPFAIKLSGLTNHLSGLAPRAFGFCKPSFTSAPVHLLRYFVQIGCAWQRVLIVTRISSEGLPFVR